MNNYPVWWETTVTVYNRYEDPITNVIRWYRHTINNCFWKNISEKINVGNTVLETNNIICRIPQQPNFVEKHNWVEISNDQMENYFTLGEGDIIVKGEIDEEINEYSSGSRATDFIAKYKLRGCLQVQEIDIAIGAGRNNPHYYVRGI